MHQHQNIDLFFEGSFIWFLWLLLFIIIVFILKVTSNSQAKSHKHYLAVLDILKKRYAQGEISRKEFLLQRQLLE